MFRSIHIPPLARRALMSFSIVLSAVLALGGATAANSIEGVWSFNGGAIGIQADPLTEVLVKINGKQVALIKGVKRLKKGITLTKLPSGTYKISIVATTVLRQRLSGSQTYKSCTIGSGLIGLKGGKKHHHG